jgi:hypothetical protein
MPLRSIAVPVLAAVVAASALYLWRRPRPRPATHEGEKRIAVTPPAPIAPTAASPVLPPRATEVQPALDRVFDRTLVFDGAAGAAYLAGDFNGDDVADLAAAVRPRGEDVLTALNADMAPWTVVDAAAPPTAAVTAPPRATVAAGDVLLAVVHGVDAGAWRSEDAREGFLVKNAVGARMHARPLIDVPPAIRLNVHRTHTGAVIAEERKGAAGLVLWTGATYAWAALPD